MGDGRFQTPRISGKEGPDIFNELPDNVLHNMLSRLRLRDAVCTQILSPRWRKLWDSKPPSALEFSLTSMFLTAKNKVYCEKYRWPCFDYRDRFLGAVDQFLKSYKGTEIDLFKVHFCLGKEYASHVDDWIKIAAQKFGVRELSLRLRCPKQCVHLQKYIFDGNLLQCEGSKLDTLILDSIQFEGLIISGPQSLLHRAPSSSRSVQRTPSCFINLTVLKLSHCMLPHSLSFRPLVNLVELLIFMCTRIRGFELCNPKMKILTCVTSPPISMNLKGVPRLLDLRCWAGKTGLSFVCSELAQQVPSLKDLRAYSLENWVNFVPGIEKIKASGTVTSLVLVFDLITKFDISKIVTILRVFPNLKQLKLRLNCPFDIEQGKAIPAGDNVHEHLQEVEISGFYGTRKQIEFVIYLLNQASSLKKLIIFRTCTQLKVLLLDESPGQTTREALRGRRSWNDGELENILTRLSSAKKPHVEVKVEDA
ncbi:hypothetical protein Dimus_033998 [Dionaea muscipula]